MNTSDEREALRAFEWIDSRAGPEWLQIFVVDALHRLQSNDCFGAFAALVQARPRLREFVSLAVREVLA